MGPKLQCFVRTQLTRQRRQQTLDVRHLVPPSQRQQQRNDKTRKLHQLHLPSDLRLIRQIPLYHVDVSLQPRLQPLVRVPVHLVLARPDQAGHVVTGVHHKQVLVLFDRQLSEGQPHVHVGHVLHEEALVHVGVVFAHGEQPHVVIDAGKVRVFGDVEHSCGFQKVLEQDR